MEHKRLARHCYVIEIDKDDISNTYRQGGEKQPLGKYPLGDRTPTIRRLMGKYKKETNRRETKQHKLKRQDSINKDETHQKQRHNITDNGADGEIFREIIQHDNALFVVLDFSQTVCVSV